MKAFFSKYKRYVDGISDRLKNTNKKDSKIKNDLVEKIEEIKTKEPMFFGHKNGLKNITILFLNTKKPLILLQTIKTVQEKHRNKQKDD